MTLEKFRESGKNVRFEDVRDKFAGFDLQQKFGRIYAGNLYIELCDDGQWLLTLGNCDFKNADITVLEKRLYEDWYLHECISTYEIQIKGRLLTIGSSPDSFEEFARYEVIAASYTEAVDYVTQFRNNRNVEEIKDIVKCKFDDTNVR